MKRTLIFLSALSVCGAALAQEADYAVPPLSPIHPVVEPSSLSDPAERRGHEVFDEWCSACHGEAADMPGTQALQAKYMGQIPALVEERTDLTPELVEFYVRNGISVMPHFRKTEISDAELDDLSAYLTRDR